MTFIKTINLKTFAAFIIINFTAAFILLTCFSPYGADTGSLTISIGDSSRAIWQGNEYLDFEHEVILIGPGGTRTQTFTGTGTARFSNLASGSYSINVRAVGDRPVAYNQFPSRMLRAYGIDTVEIRSGQTNNAHISMLPATEVTNQAQFSQAIDLVDPLLGEYIVINNNFSVTVSGAAAFANINGIDITIIAEEAVTVTSNGALFEIQDHSMLILGEPGMLGNIVFIGINTSPLITFDPSYPESSLLTINDGITLRNASNAIKNEGNLIMNGGTIIDNVIGVVNDGIFNMRGGTISDNELGVHNGSDPAFPHASFNMYGGTIRNNNNPNTAGGVYVAMGIFNMQGGTISGNITSHAGGGVYVFDTGIFTKTGGTIYGNDAGVDSNIATLGGHAVFVTLRSMPTRSTKFLNTTIGPSVNLNSEAPGTGWQ